MDNRFRTFRVHRAFLTSSLSFLVLINLLGAVAVVDGLWSKTLFVSGTVQTGDLAGVWGDLSTSDEGTTADPCTEDVNPACTPDPVTRPHIGTCAIDDAGIGTAVGTATITNVYPSYECTITGAIANIGSVPFNVIGAHLIIDNGNEAGLEQLGACELPDDVQIDPASMSYISCTVHVKDTAQAGWTYYFALETCAAQWNEDPAGTQLITDFEACKQSEQHEGPVTPVLAAPHATPSQP